MSSDTLWHLIVTFKYLALYLLVVFEGFFTTIAGGALSAQGVMNFFVVCLVVTAGDVTGDFILYTFGQQISKYRWARFIGLSPAQIVKVEKIFKRQGASHTIILAKLSSHLAIPVIVAAGATRMPKKKFYISCLVAAIIKAILLVSLGFYFGSHIHNLVNAVILISAGISILILLYWVGSHMLASSKERTKS